MDSAGKSSNKMVTSNTTYYYNISQYYFDKGCSNEVWTRNDQHFVPLVLNVIGRDVDCFSIVIKSVANQPVQALTLSTQAMSTKTTI